MTRLYAIVDTTAAARTPVETVGAPPMPMSDQATYGLASHTLTVNVESVMQRPVSKTLFFGTARQLAQPAFLVVIKHIGNGNFQAEVLLHQAAAALAPGSVLPLLSWTTDAAAILALDLPGLPTSLAELQAQGGGAMLMPQGIPWQYPTKKPISFLFMVWDELCPALLLLADQQLYYHDLSMRNVVVWCGRLYLIDFEFATWGQDCLNLRALQCYQHLMAPPEVAEDDGFTGPLGEKQMVFALGSFLLQALATDLVPVLWCGPDDSTAEELLGALRVAQRDIAAGTLAQERVDQVPAEWISGLPLVIETLSKLMNYDYDMRPSLHEAVGMVEQLIQDWREAALLLREQAQEEALAARSTVESKETAEVHYPAPAAKASGCLPRLPQRTSTRTPLTTMNAAV